MLQALLHLVIPTYQRLVTFWPPTAWRLYQAVCTAICCLSMSLSSGTIRQMRQRQERLSTMRCLMTTHLS